MPWQRYAGGLVLLCALAAAGPPAGAQGAAVPWSAFSGGFGSTAGPNVRLTGALGQPATTSAELADSRIQSGFLPGIPDTRHTSIGIPLIPLWNLVANPVITTEDSVGLLFPAANPPTAFSFTPNVGYALRSRLENGAGYWVKFGASPSVAAVRGVPFYRDTLALVDGWNLIAGVSVPVDTAAVRTVPVGLLETAFFGYFGGLVPAAELLPGYGYWVKVAADCQLVLDAGSFLQAVPDGEAPAEPFAEWNRLTVSDARGAAQVVYFGAPAGATEDPRRFELPPAGPEGIFDVRSSSGNMVERLGAGPGEVRAFTLTARHAQFPLRVRWELRDGSQRVYRLTAGAGERLLTGPEGTLEIADPAVAALTVALENEGIPAAYALEQNYPNPFNPSTTIRFALPEPGHVTLRVYDLLGREVRTLVDDLRGAGYASAIWDGTSGAGLPVSSGIYFVRLEVAGGAQPFTAHRRMLLVK